MPPLRRVVTLLRPLLALLFLAGAPGCSVYDNIFHPYRLPTSAAISPQLKKEQEEKALKAKEGSKAAKAAKKTKGQPTETIEASSADSAPSADAANPGDKPAPPEKYEKASYDKQKLLKKPKLMRRRIHKPDGTGFHPFNGIKNFFKYTVHGKPNYKSPGKGKNKDKDQAPADAPAAPDADFPGGK